MSNDENEEDDKATVVLNLDELRKQNLLDAEADPDAVAQSLEFSATKDTKIASADAADGALDDELSLDLTEDLEEKPNLLLFDYNSQFFSDNKEFFSEGGDYQIVSDLKVLNQNITKNKDWFFVFYYNDAPKPINQLLGQINKKFPNLKTLLIAKNLAPAKAQAHSKTPSAAKQYLSWPSSEDQLKECLK